MWLIRGPFDCEQTEDQTQKTKLLKTDRVYGVGRHQDSPLYINSKKVSRQNGQFIVGGHSENDISNCALIPTLSFRNNKTTAFKVFRGEGPQLLVNPETALELESGDVVNFTTSISATVVWEPIVCFYSDSEIPINTIDLSACASLGIKLVKRYTRDVTHYLLPSLTEPVTPAMLNTLLAPARFATLGWLSEVIRRGADKVQGLEKTYIPPSENAFCPEISRALAERYPSMGSTSAWAPKIGRKTLFEGMQFVFVVLGSGAGTQSKWMADVVSRGGATRRLLDIEKEVTEHARSSSWVNVLKKKSVVPKGGMRSGLVLVAEESVITARGIPAEIKKTWDAMVDSAKSADMRIIEPSLITEAVFKSDVSVCDCVIASDASQSQDVLGVADSLPDNIPSTHPEEPSQLEQAAPPSRQPSVDDSRTSDAGPSRRLTRRAASKTPVPEQEKPVEITDDSVVSPPPRRPLRRRAKAAKAGGIINDLLGIDESTVILDGSQAEPQKSPSQAKEQKQPRDFAEDFVPPTPARPSQLKRRAGTAALASQLSPDLYTVQDDVEEPRLKKFKALFEQSGLGQTVQLEDALESQLQPIREEEESQRQDSTAKRKRTVADLEPDVEMEVAEASTVPKKRAVEGINAVQQSQQSQRPSSNKPASHRAKATVTENEPKSSRAKGAAPGKPDTDPSFLRAITSTKRGKKNEDDFDREFNKLRIAKPDVNTVNNASANSESQWRKEWDNLDDFDKDVGIRGNFMQIVEMDVWRDGQSPAQTRNIRKEDGLGARIDWDGREDFKKFRRKNNMQPRIPVPLVASASQNSDADPSAAHWDNRGYQKQVGFDNITQSQENESLPPLLASSQSKARPRSQRMPISSVDPTIERNMIEEQETEEVEEEIGMVALRNKKSKATTGRRRKPLFVPASDEEEDAGVGATLRGEDEDLDSTTLQSDKSQRPKRKAIVQEESDSDNGMNFGGFAKRAKRQKR